jgi:predicted nucleotidyltransferase
MKIIDILRRHEQEIKNRFHVKRIGLFGSFARGDEKDTSDVDIMVEFEEPTFDNFMKLSFFSKISLPGKWSWSRLTP